MYTIKRLLGYARRYWYLTILTVVCMVGGVALGLVFPKILQLIIDRCIVPGRADLIPRYLLILSGLVVLKALMGFGQGYSASRVALRTMYDIRNRLFDHIQRLSFSYHDEAETGQLISRSTTDVDALRQFLGDGISNLVGNTLIFAGVLPLCLLMNWRLALLALSTMPVLAVAVIRYGRTMRPLYTAAQDQHGRMTTTIQQNLMGIRVVKAFAREDYEIKKLDSVAWELLERRMATARVSAFYGPMLDFIAALGTAFILWYGGTQVVQHRLTLGQFVQFSSYVGMLIWPVRMTGFVVDVTQNAIASGERVFEILDTHPETHLRDGNIELEECEGRVEFRNVSFGYGDGNRVLNNINLVVEPGEMVALVGRSGAGKSTIINLIPRFYDATDGTILIDGRDIREYKLSSLRRHIGIVSQEPFLFSDTIRGNIAYARPDADLDEVIEAAKAANIHDFIESLPEGYDTWVGERGVNLSGGQKQRIAIARALLMNPPILILDDSTSSVDTETEALIQKALATLMESRTTFVIAMRVSTVHRADKIVVLDKGRIVECGRHEELLARGGIYQEIYRLQLGGHELNADNPEHQSIKS